MRFFENAMQEIIFVRPCRLELRAGSQDWMMQRAVDRRDEAEDYNVGNYVDAGSSTGSSYLPVVPRLLSSGEIYRRNYLYDCSGFDRMCIRLL